MKKSAKTSSKKARELEPYDPRRVNLAKFKPDLSDAQILKLTAPGAGGIIVPFQPIETLSPTKTLGRGETNLTIIAPTIVQVDALVPYAKFDVHAQSRHPTIQMHFEPAAYGIFSPATYIMEFRIETFGQSTFDLEGSFPGTLLNTGTKTLNGPSKVSLIFQNMGPGVMYGYLEQTAGAPWSWYSTQVRFPPIVVKQ